MRLNTTCFISLQASKRGFTNKLKRNGFTASEDFQFLTNMTQKLTLTVASFIVTAVTNCKGFTTTTFEIVKKVVF